MLLYKYSVILCCWVSCVCTLSLVCFVGFLEGFGLDLGDCWGVGGSSLSLDFTFGLGLVRVVIGGIFGPWGVVVRLVWMVDVVLDTLLGGWNVIVGLDGVEYVVVVLFGSLVGDAEVVVVGCSCCSVVGTVGDIGTAGFVVVGFAGFVGGCILTFVVVWFRFG